MYELYIVCSIVVFISSLPPPPPLVPSVDPDQLLTHQSSSYAAGSGSRGEGGATGRRTSDAHPHSERKTVGLPSGELTRTIYMWEYGLEWVVVYVLTMYI